MAPKILATDEDSVTNLKDQRRHVEHHDLAELGSRPRYRVSEMDSHRAPGTQTEGRQAEVLELGADSHPITKGKAQIRRKQLPREHSQPAQELMPMETPSAIPGGSHIAPESSSLHLASELPTDTSVKAGSAQRLTVTDLKEQLEQLREKRERLQKILEIKDMEAELQRQIAALEATGGSTGTS